MLRCTSIQAAAQPRGGQAVGRRGRAVQMISQTKDAVDRLLKAGFKRKEFRVHTPRSRNREYVPYPEIHIKRWPMTGMDLINLIANGFDVLCFSEEIWLVKDREYGEPARVKVVRC